MTQNGELFGHPTPERLTSGNDCSSLPTPRAQNGEERNQNIWARPLGQPQNLENALALLPTPVVNDMGAGKDPQAWDDWTERMRDTHGNGNGHGKSLEQEALKLLPTPTAQAAKHGSTPDHTANSFGSNLWDLPHLLPTPMAQDEYERRNYKTMVRIRDEGGDMTLPTWATVVAPSLGDDMSQRLPAGSQSLDDQHQPPLFDVENATD